MSDDIQARENASPETQEILKELEAEGAEITTETKVEEPKPEAKPEVKTETKPEETKVEPVEDPDKKPDPGKKPEKVEREPQFVPVSKYNDERHKRQEAVKAAEDLKRRVEEAEAAAKAGKPKGEQTDEIDAASKALAEKHNLEPDFVKDLLNTSTELAAKRGGLSKEAEADLAAIKQMKAQAEESARAAAQETGFNKEFDDVIKEFPDLADRKEDLRQLAFSEGNVNTSLRRIALEYIHDNPPPKPGKKSAETPSRGKATENEVIDFANLTEDQFDNLTDEQHDQYMAYLAKVGKK